MFYSSLLKLHTCKMIHEFFLLHMFYIYISNYIITIKNNYLMYQMGILSFTNGGAQCLLEARKSYFWKKKMNECIILSNIHIYWIYSIFISYICIWDTVASTETSFHSFINDLIWFSKTDFNVWQNKHYEDLWWRQ